MHPAASASPDAPPDGQRRPSRTPAAVTAAPVAAPAAVALRLVLSVCVAIAAAAAAAAAWTAPAEAAHGIAMHGEPALPEDFAHLPYADPDAPEGGTVTYGILGSFDSLNPFIPRGNIAGGLRDPLYGNLVFESLLDRNRDEPFSLYGLLARDVEVAEDRSSVTFRMNPKARFSDGEPVTVEDVVFSLEILRTRGRPNYRAYYSKVTEIERIGEDGVRFVFADGSDRELPLILGLMPVLPKHAIDPEAFERTWLTAPIGSGPYRVTGIEPGKRLTLTRNPDYWGDGEPISRGRYNFETVRFDYFRDINAMFEAFKKGLTDVSLESDPTRWSTGYDFPAVAAGDVVKEEIEQGTPRGMFAFVFNTRRPIFQDIRVREALGYLIDFDWINQNLLQGLFARTTSYFEGSELASTGRPASERERALLAPFADEIRADILDGSWRPPASDGSGRDRNNMRAALKLLNEAGWTIEGRTLVHGETGEPFSFEILVSNREDERLALAYKRQLAPLGIEARVRSVDSAQYQSRLQSFDFDMVRLSWPSSLSPGNEQLNRWSSAAADFEGSYNWAGVRSPAADAMIAALLAAEQRDAFVDAVRALDRALLSGFYVVPLYHPPAQWVARWTRVGHPPKASLTGVELETWWAAPGAN